jgi:hypothetical protein
MSCFPEEAQGFRPRKTRQIEGDLEDAEKVDALGLSD